MQDKKGPINVYKLKSNKFSGAIYLTFDGSLLTCIDFHLNSPLTDRQFYWLRERLPKYRIEIQKLIEGTGMTCEEVNAHSVQDKIIMFCKYYKHYRGFNYKPQTLEKANVKNVQVTKEYLEAFFQSDLSDFTLNNYIKRFNITRDFVHNGKPDKRFPNQPDPDFEKKLSGKELSDYWAHLRKKGYVNKNGQWVEASADG